MVIKSPNEVYRKLLQAVVDGDFELVKSYPYQQIKAARCSSGCTALHWAAGTNQMDIAKLLLHDLDVNIHATKRAHGRTPLHYSCRNGHLDMV
mmetsp:Transcript_16336/g.23731  ORF Transcript_16336/g.23731 Transcript_16336/m.23731 type:complete len:93 (-) Transcript_16336:4635-4913(-)